MVGDSSGRALRGCDDSRWPKRIIGPGSQLSDEDRYLVTVEADQLRQLARPGGPDARQVPFGSTPGRASPW